MKLTYAQRAYIPGDWHIGYLDGKPAIGDFNGRWYLVEEKTVIHNRHAKLVWIVNHESHGWECISDKLWPKETLESLEQPNLGEPDHVE